MRTNIDIDDTLMADAMAASGCVTKKDTVDYALRVVVGRKLRTEAIESIIGLGWDGDLDRMRLGE